MRSQFVPWVSCVCLLFVLGASFGCSKQTKVRVTGKLLHNGSPLTVSNQAMLSVTFIPMDEANRAHLYPVNVNNADATFFLNEIPKGSYKIAIDLQDPVPSQDKYQAMFSAKRTQIVREVDGKTPLEIDLGKPQG